MIVLASACADSATGTSTTGGPTSTAPGVTTTVGPTVTTPPATTTTITAPPAGLDLSGDGWVLHTIDGVTSAAGNLLFDTDPVLGEENLVRDREGGIFFSDSFGLWWWRSGESVPALVLDGWYFRLIEAIPTANGPVVRIADVGDRYIDVTNLSEVSPIAGSVEITDDFAVIRHAANGLSATVTQPEVTLTSEGFPDEVIEPAHLVITRDEETLLDLRIGGPAEAYARIHDFDGQHLIVSRGPYEPALPPETYMVIDLSCPECTKIFVEGAASASLTGPDSDWNGDVSEPAGFCSSWDPGFNEPDTVGLGTREEASRRNLLRAAAACDFTALLYELDLSTAQIALGHADLNLADPASWLELAPDTLTDIAAALALPWRTDVIDDREVSIFPAWYGVDGWEELTATEQSAMVAWYGDDAPDVWTDYFSIGRPEDISVAISSDGRVVSLIRPLS